VSTLALTLKKYQDEALNALESFLLASREGDLVAAYAQTLARQQRRVSQTAGDGGEAPYRDSFARAVGARAGVPHVCLRIPTGGGKTVLGAHAVARVAGTLGVRQLWGQRPVVLWLTPTDMIRRQTLNALQQPDHPYALALAGHFGADVTVLELEQFATLSPEDWGHKAVILVATIQTFRINSTQLRQAYSFDDALPRHFKRLAQAVPQALDGLELQTAADVNRYPGDPLTRVDIGQPKASLANLLYVLRPVVIVDEAHNAQTDTSFKTLARFNPACIIELTATPLPGTNVLYRVSAWELKQADMIKLPVVLVHHRGDWQAVVRDARLQRDKLEALAQMEPRHIRPIMLLQAQDISNAVTSEVLKKHLIEHEKIPANQIAIATGKIKELDGVNLMDPLCPIRYVITVEALKEGWDCPFAYILCSLQSVRSGKDVEQLLGRVLRMPYAQRRVNDELNRAWAFVVSPDFQAEALALRDKMVQSMGFDALEAAQAVLPTTEPLFNDPGLPLFNQTETRPTDLVITLPASLDMSQVPLPAAARLVLHGEQVQVICRDDVTPEEATAMVAALPKAHRARVAQELADHSAMVAMLQAPSTRRLPFAALPQLVIEFDGVWQLVESQTLANIAGFSLLAEPVTGLPAYSPQENAQMATLDTSARQRIEIALDSRQLALDGVQTTITEADLICELASRVRTEYTVPGELDGYLARVLLYLQRDAGHTLTGLVRHQHELAQAISNDIATRMANARKRGFAAALALDMFSEPEGETAFRHSFRFHPDRYPARPPYYSGSVRFNKHYYPLIHDLRDGGEEWECAVAIEALQDVKHWVRNIPQDRVNSFWLPTSSDYFYPDFICELTDGRLFVVEYKGGDRLDSGDATEKARIGERWAATSKDGHCIFVQVSKADPHKRSLDKQLKDAINGIRPGA
jgi:type III restriction enzyme